VILALLPKLCIQAHMLIDQSLTVVDDAKRFLVVLSSTVRSPYSGGSMYGSTKISRS
jgi:hypothetical protein